ncbi:MAG: glutamine--fructose-6-phosphate transaminase (isomerizing), partial [Acidimicrobiia bacterium]
MCGIVGYVGPRQAQELLVASLRRLEYRGYDSAGIAITNNGRIEVRKSAGKLQRLADLLEGHPIAGTAGIGHTRWATHGIPNDINAHPHTDASGDFVLVHNGI